MPTEKEKMLAGERYDPSDPELVAERERARELTRAYNRTDPGADGRRRELLDTLFGSIGESIVVEPPVRCDYGEQIHVGDDFFANFGCVFLDICRIEFGDRCLLGPGVQVYAATHSLDPAERAAGIEYGKPVTVGDDVWMGGQAVLNPGVTVGDRSVVASGAVVTEDVPAGVVVQGNPATVVREIDE
ncbi:sugar O-acetyltransferase [Haloarcula sp. GH36]|uniref:sugar O-acetyltransferase n=1 Tax=Haloarcula montana TaxID=3111776 RepID=UPI002D77DEF4|nr:sugar O-acetyltransferase [Haloarcula sp. GH36]